METSSIRVECYCGYRSEQEPRRFFVDGNPIEITEVVDRWLCPEHRYFKVRSDDGDLYLLRHDVTEDRWELILLHGDSPGSRDA